MSLYTREYFSSFATVVVYHIVSYTLSACWIS